MHARGRLFDHHLAAIGRWRPPGKSLLRSQSGEQRTWPDGAKTSFMSHFVICGQQLLEVVLLSLRVRPHVLRRHQPGIVTKRLKLAAEMMRANAGLHTDQARRHVGQTGLHLATRPLLTQRNCTALIETYDVERVLADIDADDGNRAVETLRHGVPLSSAPLASFHRWRGRSTARPFH